MQLLQQDRKSQKTSVQVKSKRCSEQAPKCVCADLSSPREDGLEFCSEATDRQIYFQCQHSSCQASDQNEVTSEESLSSVFFLDDIHADAGGYPLLTEFAFLLLEAAE